MSSAAAASATPESSGARAPGATLELRATWRTYAGLFAITLATLMYELLLTRIFSVTMWYHFAFVAVSVAMFGMTVGALIVYLRPAWFTAAQVPTQLARSSLGFAVAIVLSFLTHLSIPFHFDLSVAGVYAIGLNYAVIALPFVFSGICVCLALTRFPRQVGRLYTADLAGAALGCVLLIVLLDLTDGPTAVVAVAAVAGLGAWLFASGGAAPRVVRAAVACTLFLALFVVGHTYLVHAQKPVLRLTWTKVEFESPPLYEKWNAFSRIQIRGNRDRPGPPEGWGLSPRTPQDVRLVQMPLAIDANAGTLLTEFDGDLGKVDFLRYDITNLVHHLRPGRRVAIVGAGGGRDVLSGLVFGQQEIAAIEINGAIIDAVTGPFGELTGHLDRRPEVTFVHDEARSYIARQREPFDVIQLAFIDTWAATAAGAFVLTENCLYTVDGWRVFLNRLTDDGVLSVSRWYFRQRPSELYRLTTLAVAALGEVGVTEPRAHIAIVRRMRAGTNATEIVSEGVPAADLGIGTLLLCRAPLKDADLDALERVCQEMEFDIVLSPRAAADPTFAQLASGHDTGAAIAAAPLDISAPTDNRPFFFNMLRLRDVLQRDLWHDVNNFNLKAVVTLGALLAVVVFLTGACIVLPLALTTRRADLARPGAATLLAFFGLIGLGFMLIEISQMQRLIVFLGHPIYGLSVVLLAILLSSSLGSLLTPRADHPQLAAQGLTRLLGLVVVLVLFGLLTPPVLRNFEGSGTPLRILLAIGLLFPMGLFLGMAFPLGMTLANRVTPGMGPWLWGVNGAASVCASVLAVVIALVAGISAAFWAGAGCYLLAFAAFSWASRSDKPSPVSLPGSAAVTGVATTAAT